LHSSSERPENTHSHEIITRVVTRHKQEAQLRKRRFRVFEQREEQRTMFILGSLESA